MYQINDVATYIENKGLATLGMDLFIYHAPPEAGNCIILFPSNDPPEISPETPFYFKGKFQTIVRNADYDAGLTLCKDLSDTLTFYNTTVGSTLVKVCRPLYQPRVFRRSDSGSLEMSITYQIHFVDKA